MSFSWANGRNLAQVTKNGAEITYSHDMDGRVIRKQVNDRVYEYVYDGSTLVAERVSYDLTEDIRIPITLQYLFDETGKRYGFRSSGMTYLYEFNGQGDVVALYNAGTKMAEYTYDAWGRVISVKSSSGQEITSPTDIANINPIRYRGYYYDVDTGLYYLQSRYYDPEIGRFVNADNQLAGVGGEICGYNMFAYGLNNPVNMSDKSGAWPKWATVALGVVAAVAAVALTVATLGAAAPAAICTMTAIGMKVGLSCAVAYTAATVTAVAVTAVAATYAADIAYSSITGDSPLLKTVFRGNVGAYNTGLMVAS